MKDRGNRAMRRNFNRLRSNISRISLSATAEQQLTHTKGVATERLALLHALLRLQRRSIHERTA